MKFVNEEMKVVNPGDAIDLNPKKDQLDDVVKQPVEEKLIAPKPANDIWKDYTTKTLVNMRKQPNTSSEVVTTIRGGDIVKVSSSFSSPTFSKAKYGLKEGYIKTEFLREL